MHDFYVFNVYGVFWSTIVLHSKGKVFICALVSWAMWEFDVLGACLCILHELWETFLSVGKLFSKK